jgi:hypothetical protein
MPTNDAQPTFWAMCRTTIPICGNTRGRTGWKQRMVPHYEGNGPRAQSSRVDVYFAPRFMTELTNFR